ncbi:hypothetical protein THASP1DRAFT_30181 [Thamnocephalis sphaerospora]|uniref:Uncharacterized protein n=1 Tax=Thamnocephalis sphaerospora TaxID=78915 RepID=A0A4P9XPS3_9FUNG|nr:hypothetical protein THASP1DRAFT_30181 [Thamnocephalis sphaerospora]|eukprot:RKP08013.1 hypothetical protein THASP1DRAFT_30181 [Thamnocephalis sphaerospora]
MRFISLSGITAAAALAGLALVGSLASAASVPPSNRIATTEDLVALDTYMGDYFQFQPKPAIITPKDSTPIHQREKNGNYFAVELYNPGGYLQRELTVTMTNKLGKPHRIDMVDYSEGSQVDKPNNILVLNYDERNENVVSYRLDTQGKIVLAEVQKNADGTNDLNVTLHPAGKKFTLKNVPLWDGKDRLFPSNKA